MGFQKKLPKIVAYRDYKIFDDVKFRHDVSSLTFDQFDVNNFKEKIFNMFDKHVPSKQKYLQPNEAL